MDTERLIDAVELESRRFAAVVAELDPSTPVAACPGWDVEQLMRHLGGVHRWATDVVAHVRTERPRRGSFAPGPHDRLAPWFDAGWAELVSALRAAPDDLECFTLYPGLDGRRFWALRQAVETALHRADAELAAGHEPHWDDQLAGVGIVEMLGAFAGPQRDGSFARTGVLAIEPNTGPPWTVRFASDALTVTEGSDADAQARTRGPAGQVLLWLWNRPSAVVVEGDRALADQWSEQVRI